MEMIDLIKVLNKQHSNLEAYLGAIMLQKQAIINGDTAELEASIMQQGELLQSIELLKKEMFIVIQDLSSKYSLEPLPSKLSEFVSTLEAKKGIRTEPLQKFQRSLKKLITKIISANAQNKFLVEHSMNFIKETISALVGENKRSLLDRKI
jgi:hypothetical protein